MTTPYISASSCRQGLSPAGVHGTADEPGIQRTHEGGQLTSNNQQPFAIFVLDGACEPKHSSEHERANRGTRHDSRN